MSKVIWIIRKEDNVVYAVEGGHTYTIHKRIKKGYRLKIDGAWTCKGSKEKCKVTAVNRIRFNARESKRQDVLALKVASLNRFYDGYPSFLDHPFANDILRKAKVAREDVTLAVLTRAQRIKKKWREQYTKCPLSPKPDKSLDNLIPKWDPKKPWYTQWFWKDEKTSLRNGHTFWYRKSEKKGLIYRINSSGTKWPVGRFSKKYPLETEQEQATRLRMKIPDNLPVTKPMEEKPRLQVIVTEKPKNREPPEHVYNGESPEVRSSEGLRRVIVPSGQCPFQLLDTKFSSIYTWAEKLRDKYQMRGEFLTIEALHYYAMYMKGFDYATAEIAAKRVRIIYEEEYEQEWTESQLKYEVWKKMREERAANPEKKQARNAAAKDKFGTKLGTAAAAINAAMTDKWQSPKQIFKKAKAKRPGHLGWLLKNGFASKSTKGNYRLKQKGGEDNRTRKVVVRVRNKKAR